jgi:hypothetical protein
MCSEVCTISLSVLVKPAQPSAYSPFDVKTDLFGAPVYRSFKFLTFDSFFIFFLFSVEAGISLRITAA